MTARIGVLLPASNTTVESELGPLDLADTTFHFQRMRSVPGTTGPERIRAMDADAGPATDALGAIDPAVMVFGCTIGTMVDGTESENALRAAISASTTAPVVIAGRAVADALRHLGISRIAIGSATESWMTDAAVGYLAEYGIEVLWCTTLGRSGAALAAISVEEVVALAVAADRPDAEAVYLFGTSLPTFSALDAAEAAVGKPVLSTNASSLWAILRTLGRDVAGQVPGILFRAPAASVALTVPSRTESSTA